MTRKFTIKKEIRSLGIDLCTPDHIIGAVVRGGVYLDGIVVFSPRQKRSDASIANSVVRSRFFPELKLIMIHDPEERLNTRQVEKITRLPVIEVRVSDTTIIRGYEAFRARKRLLWARSSLDTMTVQNVLAMTWTTGTLPESLRVAHLIAKSRFLGEKCPFWANK